MNDLNFADNLGYELDINNKIFIRSDWIHNYDKYLLIKSINTFQNGLNVIFIVPGFSDDL